MIDIKNLNFAYNETETLKSINLKIKEGECVLILGKSGCGKSTLLKTLDGIIPNMEKGKFTGEIEIAGQNIIGSNIQEISKLVGSVFQNPKSQFFNFNTNDEIVFGCSNHKIPAEEMQRRLDSTIKAFNIKELSNRDIFQLSGGEKQKIACASVYSLSPKVFVFDEPSSNLDLDTINDLSKIIKTLKSQGHTIVVAEHRIYYLMDICDRVVYLDEGEIKKDFSIDQFKRLNDEERKKMGLRSLKKESINISRDINKIEKSFTIRNLKYSYNKKSTVLDIDDFNFEEGKILALIGSNGSGKSTFAKSLCGLNKSKGFIYKGKNLKYKQRNKIFSLVMQDVNNQLFTESVIDELMLNFDYDDKNKISEAEDILNQLNLLNFKEAHPLSLSGGQKQRVMIAASIFESKDFLILDEPTSGLDYLNMLRVSQLIKSLKGKIPFIIIITHDTEFINLCCDGVVEMKMGKLEEIC